MYLERMIELLFRNYCCCGTAISITYSECVFVALVTQHPKHMRHIQGVSGGVANILGGGSMDYSE